MIILSKSRLFIIIFFHFFQIHGNIIEFFSTFDLSCVLFLVNIVKEWLIVTDDYFISWRNFLNISRLQDFKKIKSKILFFLWILQTEWLDILFKTSNELQLLRIKWTGISCKIWISHWSLTSLPNLIDIWSKLRQPLILKLILSSLYLSS